MKQYLKLLKEVKEKGVLKGPARDNMPNTSSLFGTRMEFDMKDGFPLLTTKEMYFKGIVAELLWFLKGDTNIKYLVDNGCNIWNKDAYKWFLKKCADTKIKTPQIVGEGLFIRAIKERNTERINDKDVYLFGDLGRVYGHQWRNQNGVDQLAELIKEYKKNKNSRRLIIDAWSPSDLDHMALPPCHLLYQFYYRKESTGKEFLDLQMYQRSGDVFLGVPFNIASSSLFLHIMSKLFGVTSGKLIWVGGDVHLYENHQKACDIQLKRKPLDALPNVTINKDLNSIEDIESLEIKDIVLTNYTHQKAIKAPLSVGL